MSPGDICNNTFHHNKLACFVTVATLFSKPNICEPTPVTPLDIVRSKPHQPVLTFVVPRSNKRSSLLHPCFRTSSVVVFHAWRVSKGVKRTTALFNDELEISATFKRDRQTCLKHQFGFVRSTRDKERGVEKKQQKHLRHFR